MTNMEKRRLGRTGLEATILGLGGAPLSGQLGRDVPEADALETVWATLEAGINLIDTAPLYGEGRSEPLIGRALRERSDLAQGCILSTKVGRYPSAKADYSYDATLRSVERSLELLGVSHLPIVHIHDVQTAEQLRAIVCGHAAHAALRQLQAQGVVGFIGLGTRGLSALRFAVESGEFDVVMMANQYNLLVREGQEILELAAQRDVGVMLAGVYATGILAQGSASPEARFLYRGADPAVRQRVAALENLCQKWGCSLAAAALQFCLRGPAAKAIAVVGARNRQQVQENVARLNEAIAPGFWAELESLA